MWTIVAAVLIAVALYVVENYGGNGFVPSWDQIYQWVGLEPSQSETTAPLPEGETEVVFLDVGQGDAVLILQNGAACLIDAGPKDARQNLVQDLRSYGVSQLDLLVMTHPHADHVGGMQAVLQNFDVQTLLTPDLSETDVTGQTQRTLQTAQECGVPVETAYTGQQYTIGTGPISGTKGTLDYDQLVEFWGQFDPYTMNTILCSTATMTSMLKISELQNPLTGLNFQGTGKLSTPLGAQLHRTSAVSDGVIIGLDNRYALELVRAGDVLVEYDKLIDRQLERAAITSISGFGKICDGASLVLNV